MDAVRSRTPLAVELALQRRWDLLLLLAQAGADLKATRDDGNVAGELSACIDEAWQQDEEPSPDLLRVQALFGALK